VMEMFDDLKIFVWLGFFFYQNVILNGVLFYRLMWNAVFLYVFFLHVFNEKFAFVFCCACH
jgi:hypothetical protein